VPAWALWRWRWIVGLLLIFLNSSQSYGQVAPGYTFHFNFLDSPATAVETVALAGRAAARMISLVPPAHIWEDRSALATLDASIAAIKHQGLRFVFSRMDANQSSGQAWLYHRVLARPGRLPDGSPTSDCFRSTVGNLRFERWQNQETRYYAGRYGRLPQLAGFAVGGMVEPFVSQRGSLMQWDEAHGNYEIAQYTKECRAEWHRWLRRRFGGLQAINRAYRTHFSRMSRVPMPSSGDDLRFGRPREAYFDFARSINDWFVRQYRSNRRLWHQFSNKPFLLQLSGFESEKIARGRPEFAAFDLPSWVAQADAVGISLYTHAGYSDWGHSANKSTVRLLLSARDSGKSAFIMESGCEAPRVTLRSHELSFVTSIGLLLDPIGYIYEYFRYERDGRVDPGMMVSPNGDLHQPGFARVSSELRSMSEKGKGVDDPCFVYLSAPFTARNSLVAGLVNRAVYHLAGYLPCRLLPWRQFNRIPTGSVVLVPPGFHRVADAKDLKMFLNSSKTNVWHLISDAETCQIFRQLGPQCSVQALQLERLLEHSYVEEQASVLHEELAKVNAFQQRLDQQPVEPRTGLSWLETDSGLSLWLEDREPVRLRWETLHRHNVQRIWGSSRNGQPIQVLVALPGGKQLDRTLPCRQWVVVDDLLVAADLEKLKKQKARPAVIHQLPTVGSSRDPLTAGGDSRQWFHAVVSLPIQMPPDDSLPNEEIHN
jgi:hypothetical protein